MTRVKNSHVAARLAKRVPSERTKPRPVSFADTQLPDTLFEYLGQHLAAGETHYTTRPGLTELRQAIGSEVGKLGCTERQADGVIVTQGEGEALYVSLLGLGIGAGTKVLVAGECDHVGLLDMLGISVVRADDPGASKTKASFCEFGDVPRNRMSPEANRDVEIVALGNLLFSDSARDVDLSSLSNDVILIGQLDSLPGLDHFRMGYVAAPPEIAKKIQTWKQALSICSAAPSQRAALFAISQESAS